MCLRIVFSPLSATVLRAGPFCAENRGAAIPCLFLSPPRLDRHRIIGSLASIADKNNSNELQQSARRQRWINHRSGFDSDTQAQVQALISQMGPSEDNKKRAL